MTGWTAIVPIKPAGQRKTRLASCLSPAGRIAVTEAMLSHVLATLDRVPAIAEVAVLARDRPRGWQGRWLRDDRAGLNDELGAVSRAIDRRLLIVHADLPMLTADDVAALIIAATEGAALAPDRHRRGTNAIAADVPGDLRFAFGPDSFRQHRVNLPDAVIVDRPGLAFDVDDEADWAEALRRDVLTEYSPSAG